MFHLSLYCHPQLLLPPFPQWVFNACVCVCVNGSISISYRCKQWWVSIKVFAWGTESGAQAAKTRVGGLARGGTHRHSLIHRNSRSECGGAQTPSLALTPTFYKKRVHDIIFCVYFFSSHPFHKSCDNFEINRAIKVTPTAQIIPFIPSSPLFLRPSSPSVLSSFLQTAWLCLR